MVKLEYNKKKTKWETLPLGSPDGIYLNVNLLKKLENVHKLIRKNFDAVILISGGERVGKSTLGMAIGHYLSNGTLTINNFASGMNDAAEKIKNLPNKSVLIVDEASLVASSKDTMKKEQKHLMKILDVVGQKNMIFIFILPSFFDLNKQVALRRSKFLLHCYVDEHLNRGKFAYFGEKKKRILYHLGKKNFDSYAKPHPDWRGDFPAFKPVFYEQYLELKKKSLIEALTSEAAAIPETVRRVLFRKYVQEFRKNCPDITNKVLAAGFGVSERSIYRHLQENGGLTPEL